MQLLKQKALQIHLQFKTKGTTNSFAVNDLGLLANKFARPEFATPITKLEDVQLGKAINYCEAYNLPLGLLINFGAKSLDFHRIFNFKHPDNKNNRKEN